MGEIRFVGTGETRRYPYLVCKKIFAVIVPHNFLFRMALIVFRDVNMQCK